MKSKQAIRRLKRRTAKHHEPQTAEQAAKSYSLKEAEMILIDLSLKSLYNNGDKRELNFETEILAPNKVSIPAGQPLESFWDILTNTGLMQAVIGFGKHGKLSLTNEGYQIMNQYGSYGNYLKMRKGAVPSQESEESNEAAAVAAPKNSETGNVAPMDGVH